MPHPAELSERRRELRRAAVSLLVALVAQFLAGMLVNLFVTIPDGHPGWKPDEYFSGSLQSVAWAIVQSGLPALIAHATFGLLLVVGSLSFAIQARSAKRRAVTVGGVLGFVLVLGAGFNGASFLDFGEDFSSMLMATLFGLAVLDYVIVLSALAEG